MVRVDWPDVGFTLPYISDREIMKKQIKLQDYKSVKRRAFSRDLNLCTDLDCFSDSGREFQRDIERYLKEFWAMEVLYRGI